MSIPIPDSKHNPPHQHLRGRYCPAAMAADPFVPTKPASRFFVELSVAVLHEETWSVFTAAHPDDFPTFTSADPVDAELRTVTP